MHIQITVTVSSGLSLYLTWRYRAPAPVALTVPPLISAGKVFAYTIRNSGALCKPQKATIASVRSPC